uniref:Uncharacterized protein n=1 Tax=Timema monikensis TaxID=170555 RepID=A0A7R9ECJ5_9NEOP|nr:unnamed protein product [Timema monikensis]
MASIHTSLQTVTTRGNMASIHNITPDSHHTRQHCLTLVYSQPSSAVGNGMTRSNVSATNSSHHSLDTGQKDDTSPVNSKLTSEGNRHDSANIVALTQNCARGTVAVSEYVIELTTNMAALLVLIWQEGVLTPQHTLRKKLPSTITSEPALREQQCSLYLSVPPLYPLPSYMRMHTTVKHHVTGTVKRTVPYKDIFLRLLSSGKFKMLESIVILILLSGAFQHLSLAVDMDQEQLPQEKCKSMVR